MPVELTALLYLVSSVLFILALKGLSSPETARRGNLFGIVGMVIAVLVTAFGPHVSSYGMLAAALVVGGGGGIGNGPAGGGTGANCGGSGVYSWGGGAGGAGGSGVVIIRYPSYFLPATSTTGSPTITVTGGYRYYKFTQSGTLTF